MPRSGCSALHGVNPHFRFSRKTLEIPLISYKVNIVPTWSSGFVISAATGLTIFAVTDIEALCSSSSIINSRQCKSIASVNSDFNW